MCVCVWFVFLIRKVFTINKEIKESEVFRVIKLIYILKVLLLDVRDWHGYNYLESNLNIITSCSESCWFQIAWWSLRLA